MPETAKKNGARIMLARILHRDNLNAAFKRVKRNGGCAGIDGMTVDEMLPYLKEHGENACAKYSGRRYKPQACQAGRNTKTGWGSEVAWSTDGNRPYDTTGNRTSATADI